MSEAKHTPGPWTADVGQFGLTDAASVFVENEPDASLIADCTDFDGPRSVEECQANALLITAAPEMLAALKIVERDRLNCNGRVLEIHAQIIRAAIAKAEGRS